MDSTTRTGVDYMVFTSVVNNSKTAWREWYQQCEFQREIQTENLVVGANTREINLSGAGKWIAAIELKFLLTLNNGAGAIEAPIPGGTVLEVCVDDLRIKGPGKFLEYNWVNSESMRHTHRLYLDEDVLEYIPTFTIAVETRVATAKLTLPVTLNLGAGYYSMVLDAALNNIIRLYAADIAVTGCTCTINIVSTDTPPPCSFAIQSQTALLPPAGRANISTLYQGYCRESISMIGEWWNYACAGAAQAAIPGVSNFDTIDYQLPSGRTVISEDYEELRHHWFSHSRVHRDGAGTTYVGDTDLEGFATGNDLAWSLIRGECSFETAYRSAAGALEPWNDGGVFAIETVANAGAAKTPTIVEVLLKDVVSQPNEVSPLTGNRGPAAPGSGGLQPLQPGFQPGTAQEKRGVGRF